MTPKPDSEIAWSDWLARALAQGWEACDRLRDACRRRPTPKRVHALRTATRRLLAQVAVAEAVRGKRARKLQRTLRRLLRATTEVRDADVQMRAIERRMREHARLAGFRRHVRRRRRRAAREATAALRRGKLRRRVQHLVAGVRAARADRRMQTFVRSVLRAAWVDAATLVEASRTDAGKVHRARKATKHLRYLAELLREQLPPGVDGWIDALRRRQRAMGEIHDLEVLCERLDRYLAGRGAKRKRLIPVTTALASQRRIRLARHGRAGLPEPPWLRGKAPLLNDDGPAGARTKHGARRPTGAEPHRADGVGSKHESPDRLPAVLRAHRAAPVPRAAPGRRHPRGRRAGPARGR